MEQKLITLIESATEARGELPVPRNFIEDALIRIESGEEDIAKYPTGAPSLKEVFDIAVRIESNIAIKN